MQLLNNRQQHDPNYVIQPGAVNRTDSPIYIKVYHKSVSFAIGFGAVLRIKSDNAILFSITQDCMNTNTAKC